MSERTPCNYCSWRRLCARHPGRVVLRAEPSAPDAPYTWLGAYVDGQRVETYAAIGDGCEGCDLAAPRLPTPPAPGARGNT